jgi:hypothetical protein
MASASLFARCRRAHDGHGIAHLAVQHALQHALERMAPRAFGAKAAHTRMQGFACSLSAPEKHDVMTLCRRLVESY